MNKRCVELGMSFEELDARSGLADRYTTKLLSASPSAKGRSTARDCLLPALRVKLALGTGGQFTFPVLDGFAPSQPRIWFVSADAASLIQLQSGRLFFNWRGGLQQNAYPHFDAVHAEFMKAIDELEALSRNEGLGDVIINQCELVYVNPLPVSATDVPLSEPQRIFRIWSDSSGEEWKDSPEDISFSIRYRFNDKDGNPFGRLIAALSSGWAQDGSPAFRLEMTARGQPIGSGRAGITAFHEYAHQAIVRCFAAITTPEMHQRWERYQ